MSNAVFPSLPGLGWSVIKTPRWKTNTQETTSGKEIRVALMSYPIWEFTLTFDFLRSYGSYTEAQTLMGFFLQRQGMFDSWLFDDPSDDTVVAQAFGVGNGSTTAFQLARTLGGFTEPLQNVNGTPTIYVNGVTASGYTVGSTGIVTFTTAPASGAVLTWSGNFYFRCRFMQDTSDFEQFAKNFWLLKKLQFQSCKL